MDSDPEAVEIVRRYFERPAAVLYDLQTDSLEQTNLAYRPEHIGRVRALRARLESCMHEQRDKRMVLNDPYPASGPRPNAQTVRRD